MSSISPVEFPPDFEIVTTRIFDAPRETVFECFSDPQQLARWWGPKGFKNTFQEFNLNPRGRWRFVMHAPNGTDYPNENEFTVVEAPARIVFEHLDATTHRFRTTMTFVDRSGKTALTWRMRFASAEEFHRLKDFLVGANEENFDRLAAHLAQRVST
ncbi:MAG: SRPBCC family protein [Opitutaceae bacterium]